MKKWTIYILLCWLSSVTFGQDNEVSVILDKLTNLYDNYHKCHLKSEATSIVRDGPKTIEFYKTGEVFYDNDRVNNKGLIWGEVDPSGKVVPKEQAEYVRTMYDGQAVKHYAASPKRNVYTMDPTISKEKSQLFVKQALSRGWLGSEALGYFGDDRRIDVCLKNAEEIQLSNRKVSVNGSECYVLEAVSGNVNYKLWIDPDHGYNIAKAVVSKKPGSYMGSKRLVSGESIQIRIDTVSYKKANDVWMVSEASIQKKSNTKEFKFQDKTQYKLLEANFDPDFDKLNAFSEDDVENGTKVYIVGVHGINYTWQDGELVPDVDEAAIDAIDKMAEEVLAEERVRESASEKAVAGDSVMLGKILLEYKKTQERFSVFYCESTTSGKSLTMTQGYYARNGDRFSVRVKTGVRATEGVVWDGKRSVHYSGASRAEMEVSASADQHTPQSLLATVYPGSPLLGYLNSQAERIDTLLSKASKEASVSEEKLDGKNCYVVKAAIGKDVYRVWFSPEQGYHIVKAEVRADSEMVYRLDQVRFKVIEGIRVPASCAVKDAKRRYSYKRTKIDLKPDFEALKAFEVPISDGTGVTVEGMTGKYYWNNGRVVDKGGKDVF